MDDTRAKDRPPEFDDVFEHVQSFGRFQRILYLCTHLLIIPVMLHFNLMIFAMGTPQFHCDVTNTTCPPNECCKNCTSYAFDGPFTSIISEWNLICDGAALGATVQSCLFAGMLVSCLFAGYLSDMFGRKKCMFTSVGIMSVASLAASYAPSLVVYASLQFCVGLGMMSFMLSLFTFGVEIVGPSWRTMAGNLNGMYWASGAFLGILLAYYIRDWQTLTRISVAPMFLFLFFVKAYPDSPRYLLVKGRVEDSMNILMKFGGKGVQPKPEVLRALLEDILRAEKKTVKKEKRYTPLDLIRTPKMRKFMFLMGINWFVTATMDFALYLSVTSLFGDIYLNFFLLQFPTLPLMLIAWVAMKRLGRRVTSITARVLAGLVCLLILAVPQEYPMAKSLLSIGGYSISYVTWPTCYLMTSELFPTVLRNTSLATGSICARIAALIAPYIAMLGHLPGVGMTVPIAVFGGLAIATAIATLWVPETLFARMHQTVEEAEAATDYYGMPCCGRQYVEPGSGVVNPAVAEESAVEENRIDVTLKSLRAVAENGTSLFDNKNDGEEVTSL